MKQNLTPPGKTYLVGGAVRDHLLGYPYTEKDYVVVGATPEAMIAAGYTAVGKAFPVFLHPGTKEEYALARSERKTGKGYHGFECIADPNVTLEEDLKRRDLTINAMAMGDAQNVIDPYGGQKDLQQKVLRHVSDAFVEDPVRILRAARFAARFARLGFTISPDTMELMKKMVEAGEVNALVAERVWKETERAFLEKNPEIYIQVLRECGALKILFPELDAALDTSAQQRFEHLQKMCELTQDLPAAEIPTIRFAVLANGLIIHSPNVPPNWNIFPQLLMDNAKDLRALFDLPAERILNLLLSLDAFRRNFRFGGFLRIISVLYGEKAANYLNEACHAANSVDISLLIKKNMTGPEIKEAIYEGQAKTIDAWLKSR